VFRLIYSGEATTGIAEEGSSVLNVLAQFCCLQVLDVLTTLAFLANGVREANPIVRFSRAAWDRRWEGC